MLRQTTTWQVVALRDSRRALECGGAFVRFLDRMAAASPRGQVVVVLDNVGYHNSHAVRRWWVAHADRVRPLWLPAYARAQPHRARLASPKDKLANHRWWADLPALERATGHLLDRTTARFHKRGGTTTPRHPVHHFCEAA